MLKRRDPLGDVRTTERSSRPSSCLILQLHTTRTPPQQTGASLCCQKKGPRASARDVHCAIQTAFQQVA
jgi:hypothetical protein